MAALDEVSESIARLARETGPAVVGIGPGWRGGSGVVIADGRVLTAAHNLRGEGGVVVFADGRRERASLLGADRDLDLAVLGLDTGDAPVIEPGADALSIGSLVFALARPGTRALR